MHQHVYCTGQGPRTGGRGRRGRRGRGGRGRGGGGRGGGGGGSSTGVPGGHSSREHQVVLDVLPVQHQETIVAPASGQPSQLTDQRFDELSISPLTLKALHDVLRYKTMTKVQASAVPPGLFSQMTVIVSYVEALFCQSIATLLYMQWPLHSCDVRVYQTGLTGVDILAKAKTGTGKTIGFLIPVIQKCITSRNHQVLEHQLFLMTSVRHVEDVPAFQISALFHFGFIRCLFLISHTERANLETTFTHVLLQRYMGDRF